MGYSSFCLLLFLLLPQNLRADSAAPRVLRLELAVKKDSEMGLQMQEALRQAFGKGGYAPTFEAFPSRRGIEELKNGRIDGSAGRIGSLDRLFDIPDLVRIDVPISMATLSLWCTKPFDKLLSVKNPRVALFHGSIFAAQLVKTVEDKSIEFVDIPTYLSMVSMINKGRLDCFIGSESTLLAEGIGMENVRSLFRHDLVTSAVYPWIHRRFADTKAIVEKELLAYDFPPAWKKKYRTEKAACKGRFDLVCPDGRIFTKEQLFSPLP